MVLSHRYTPDAELELQPELGVSRGEDAEQPAHAVIDY